MPILCITGCTLKYFKIIIAGLGIILQTPYAISLRVNREIKRVGDSFEFKNHIIIWFATHYCSITHLITIRIPNHSAGGFVRHFETGLVSSCKCKLNMVACFHRRNISPFTILIPIVVLCLRHCDSRCTGLVVSCQSRTAYACYILHGTASCNTRYCIIRCTEILYSLIIIHRISITIPRKLRIMLIDDYIHLQRLTGVFVGLFLGDS